MFKDKGAAIAIPQFSETDENIFRTLFKNVVLTEGQRSQGKTAFMHGIPVKTPNKAGRVQRAVNVNHKYKRKHLKLKCTEMCTILLYYKY